MKCAKNTCIRRTRGFCIRSTDARKEKIPFRDPDQNSRGPAADERARIGWPRTPRAAWPPDLTASPTAGPSGRRVRLTSWTCEPNPGGRGSVRADGAAGLGRSLDHSMVAQAGGPSGGRAHRFARLRLGVRCGLVPTWRSQHGHPAPRGRPPETTQEATHRGQAPPPPCGQDRPPAARAARGGDRIGDQDPPAGTRGPARAPARGRRTPAGDPRRDGPAARPLGQRRSDGLVLSAPTRISRRPLRGIGAAATRTSSTSPPSSL